jgi:hypothetical protein
MHGLEPLAPTRGSNVSVVHKSSDVAAPDMKWSQFFQGSGGAFMRVLDDVFEEFVANKRYLEVESFLRKYIS